MSTKSPFEPPDDYDALFGGSATATAKEVKQEPILKSYEKKEFSKEAVLDAARKEKETGKVNVLKLPPKVDPYRVFMMEEGTGNGVITVHSKKYPDNVFFRVPAGVKRGRRRPNPERGAKVGVLAPRGRGRARGAGAVGDAPKRPRGGAKKKGV